MALPGASTWRSALVGYTHSSPWDEQDSCGVILFDDGSVWSYEGDGGGRPDSLRIAERTPGAGIWERLTPDLGSFASGMFGSLNAVRHPTNLGGTGWRHIHTGDDVWFYRRYWSEGLMKVNRITRTWEYFPLSAQVRLLWSGGISNVVLNDGSFWFLTRGDHSVRGVGLVRVPLQNPGTALVMHWWDDPIGWRDVVTTSVSLPGYLDNQFVWDSSPWWDRGGIAIAIEDGYLYLFTKGSLHDPKTTHSVRHDLLFSTLRRSKIGSYKLEVLLWHTSLQGYVGEGAGRRGATLGLVGSDLLRWGDERRGYGPGIGMGFSCIGSHAPAIHDGWLYWFDRSLIIEIFNPEVWGHPAMICRINLAVFDGQPIRHDPFSPSFEVIVGGDINPSASPITAVDDTMTFDSEGALWLKGLSFPKYYQAGYEGINAIRRYFPNIRTTSLTVTFTGSELKGYSSIRETAVTRRTTEVELRG